MKKIAKWSYDNHLYLTIFFLIINTIIHNFYKKYDVVTVNTLIFVPTLFITKIQAERVKIRSDTNRSYIIELINNFDMLKTKLNSYFTNML